MDQFKYLFGIESASVKKTVILLPFIPGNALELLGVPKLAKGLIFAAASTETFTVIKAGMGAGFVGDAVLYLKNTSCENIIFFGACGLLHPKDGLDIGSLVTPVKTWAMESFSNILADRIEEPLCATPHEGLLAAFTQKTGLNLPGVHCVSFASIHEEARFTNTFQKLGAEIIEMECAAFFLAAQKTHKKAMALLFISDVLTHKPLSRAHAPEDKQRLAEGLATACQAIIKW
ncbi:MAG: hypothetical protein HQL19_08160 [Candidatus Omnitrophica bacterium]|nr:hypothetical protein [Candidatus Omnitrophota bacterium]